MRVNIYAEEMTDRLEIITKTTADGIFTGVRFYLELPCTIPVSQEELLAGVESPDGKKRKGIIYLTPIR